MPIEFQNKPLEWKNEGAEPSEELKTTGFQAGYKPPAQIFNYQLHNTSACLTELQEQTSSIQTQLDNKVDKGALVSGVKGDSETSYRTGNVNITKANIGLSNVDNTSDANKPISTATQTALDGKQASITGGASTITSSNLTTNRALISNSSGKVAVSAVTSTELGYLDGVTSSVQTQLDSKVNLDDYNAHTHTKEYMCTLSASGWSSTAPYTRTETITGITSSDTPIVDVILSTTTSTALNQLEAWGCVSKITTGTDSITVTCFEEKPSVSLTLQLKVVR